MALSSFDFCLTDSSDKWRAAGSQQESGEDGVVNRSRIRFAHRKDASMSFEGRLATILTPGSGRVS